MVKVTKMNAKCVGKNCFCWNGCDELLYNNIERSKFVKNIRIKLTRKKFKEKFK